MNKTQWYFFRQRLIGLMIILGNIFLSVCTGEGSIGILLIPFGLFLMFTKEMIIQDKYFFEVNERKLKKMRKELD